VGLYLKDAINRHFKAAAKPCALKYIDPSYIIRSSPPCASDSNLCTVLAHNAVHGAMAGFTGVSVGVRDGVRVLVGTGVSVRVVTDVRGPRSLMFGAGAPFGPRELYALSSTDGTLRGANVVVRGVPQVVPAR
jgi:6-phosphofructokinase 1